MDKAKNSCKVGPSTPARVSGHSNPSRTLAGGETRATPTGRPNHHANTSSNASSSSSEEEQAVAEQLMDVTEDPTLPASSTRENNQTMPGPGQTTSNPSGPPDQPEENHEYSIFDDAYEMKFKDNDEILHAGNGRNLVKGFNRSHDMTFEGFRLTAAGELHRGRVGPDDVPSSKAGAGMKYFGQAHHMEFKGTKMQFIAGKVVEVEERVPAPTTSSPQWNAPPQAQTYGGNAYNQPSNMHMYLGPQAQGNGWDNYGQRYGQDWGQGWGGPPPPQVQMTQTITASASYGHAPAGRMIQQSHPPPEERGYWHPQNQQYAYAAEPAMRPPAGPVYGNPPQTYNSHPPPPPTNYPRNHYRPGPEFR
ncbi:hypothetical protein D9758_007685 [Tetrapyrgos nigripes]|uniref:Uncharacterized protein n=1 Tax=Tetrapyrgos nigripes TaxID=182062 RepID=A0A8H5G5H7_9AGAR|nr:hypothetical protein D9758_007685 [Tetrapyrgos nigripes]